MTREEKAAAIANRAQEDLLKKPFAVSLLMICHYLSLLEKKGLIDGSPIKVSDDKGKKILAICQEFDWQVTDEEITLFIREEMSDLSDLDKGVVFLMIKDSIRESNSVGA